MEMGTYIFGNMRRASINSSNYKEHSPHPLTIRFPCVVCPNLATIHMLLVIYVL
jgi:hypothetical protein